jgi:hypothetical protein
MGKFGVDWMRIVEVGYAPAHLETTYTYGTGPIDWKLK